MDGQTVRWVGNWLNHLKGGDQWHHVQLEDSHQHVLGPGGATKWNRKQ